MDQSSRSSSIHQPHHTQMSTFSIIMMSLPRGQITAPGLGFVVLLFLLLLVWDGTRSGIIVRCCGDKP